MCIRDSAITVDSTDNAYVTGYTYSTNFPTTPGAFQTTLGGPTGVFVTKINPTASEKVYSTYLNGSATGTVSYTHLDVYKRQHSR